MISKLEFEDLRMFQGKHEITLNPLTIFTGPNNAGKSTIIKLLQSLIEGSSQLWMNNKSFDNLFKENDSLFIRINDISIQNSESSKFPILINFLHDNSIVATLCDYEGPCLVFEYDWALSIKMNLSDLYALTKGWADIKEVDTESKQFKENLKYLLQKGIPESLFYTRIKFLGAEFQIFDRGEKSEFELLIILHSGISQYKELLKDSYYSYLASYSRDICAAIMQNDQIEIDLRHALTFVLEYFFRFYIFSSIQEVKKLKNKYLFYSAYRGAFISESDSQAKKSFKMLQEKMPQLLSLKRQEGYVSFADYLDRDDANLLNRWLRMFGIGTNLFIDVKQLETFKVILSEGVDRYPFELGFGNQQLLPLILGLVSNAAGLSIIEEPESHLHPCLQSMLADMFVDAIKNRPYMPSQLIVETHSEYLIRKLQHFVANGQIDPNEISLYYIHDVNSIPSNENHIRRMEFETDGTLKTGFGSGFFDESINLKLELLKLKNVKKY